MKVIDLISKIANKGPLPNKIKIECVNSINEHNCYYHFNPIAETYVNDDNTLIQNATCFATLLDLEVEIIEEDKKIEKIKDVNTDYYSKGDGYESLISIEGLVLDIQTLKHKVNEIIDYINEVEQ